jgi:nucleoside 2-deoxyribosyltransferase
MTSSTYSIRGATRESATSTEDLCVSQRFGRSCKMYNDKVPTCFVIQPFDDPYDKRYDDTIAPAIEEAGLDPYRVDRDPRVVIPIEQIVEGIRSCQACVADISTDNPNVWFELGYALACGKSVVLLAYDDSKRRFPFDIQHRHVIRYRTESSSDFVSLGQEITNRLRAVLAKEERLERIVQPSSVADVQGLTQYELVALVSIAENSDAPSSAVPAHDIRNDMERSGFTRVAIMLALGQLARKGLVSWFDDEDYNRNPCRAYKLTEEGLNWLFEHQDLLVLRRFESVQADQAHARVEDDDEVPF